MSSGPDGERASVEPTAAATDRGAPAAGASRGWARFRSPHVWVSTTNFAEGFPYAIVHNLSEAIFVSMGASLKSLGLTSLFHLPWNLKFAWGPLVDRYGTKRAWLLAMEVVLSLVLLVAAFLVEAGSSLAVLSVLFVAMAFFAATHDIGIDAYYLEALDEAGQSKYVGYRAAAYRVSVLLLTGPIVAFGARFGWGLAVGACLVVMLGLFAFHAKALPKVEHPQRPFGAIVRELLRLRVLGAAILLAGISFGVRDRVTLDDVVSYSALGLAVALGAALISLPILKVRLRESEGAFATALVSFLDQRRVAVILGFTLSFRLGESFLGKMKMAFMTREAGLSMESFSWANGTVGILALFAATLVGGRMIARDGLRRWIWPFTLSQNLLNLLYAAIAHFGVTSTSALFGVIAFERAGEGLGTAVFMVYLMRTCDPRHKAAHFALVSALMSVGFTLAGSVSGILAEKLGFAGYFAFTCLATVPGMAFIFFLPHLDGREGRRDPEPAEVAAIADDADAD